MAARLDSALLRRYYTAACHIYGVFIKFACRISLDVVSSSHLGHGVQDLLDVAVKDCCARISVLIQRHNTRSASRIPQGVCIMRRARSRQLTFAGQVGISERGE